jgi:hypothetical protein
LLSSPGDSRSNNRTFMRPQQLFNSLTNESKSCLLQLRPNRRVAYPSCAIPILLNFSSSSSHHFLPMNAQSSFTRDSNIKLDVIRYKQLLVPSMIQTDSKATQHIRSDTRFWLFSAISYTDYAHLKSSTAFSLFSVHTIWPTSSPSCLVARLLDYKRNSVLQVINVVVAKNYLQQGFSHNPTCNMTWPRWFFTETSLPF